MLFNRLFHNCGLKFISLVLAICLSIWVAYFSNNPVPDTIEIPLRVSGLPPELFVNTDDSRIPETIRVDIRGPYRAIADARRMNQHASLNLSEASPQSRVQYRVQLPNLGDLTVLDHDPKAVLVTIETKSEKALNIEVERRGNVREDFMIGKEDVNPSVVNITGPESLVGRITRAVVDPRIQGLADQDVQDLIIKFYDDNDKQIPSSSLDVNPAAAQYRVQVIPTGSLRVLEVSPHIVGEVADGFRLGTSKPVPIYVTAPASEVPEGVYYVRTSRLDVSGLTETQVFTGLEILYPFTLPENSNLPLTCDVSVEVRPITENEVLVDIELVNRHGDMDYNISPERLVVRSEELGELSEEELASQVRAWIDVGSMEPGQVKRIPQLELPMTLQHITLDRFVVTISINRKDA